MPCIHLSIYVDISPVVGDLLQTITQIISATTRQGFGIWNATYAAQSAEAREVQQRRRRIRICLIGETIHYYMYIIIYCIAGKF